MRGRPAAAAAAAAALLLLAACGRNAPAPAPTGAGDALERAALAAGLVIDPARVAPTGVFASETDRVCIRPGRHGYRIGASVDYGAGQRCVARGIAAGRNPLTVDLGGGCRFAATVDGARIRFPATLPDACDRQCEGRASLAAVDAARLSDAPAEAARTRGIDGALLCDS